MLSGNVRFTGFNNSELLNVPALIILRTVFVWCKHAGYTAFTLSATVDLFKYMMSQL